jgi:hypothetical protein
MGIGVLGLEPQGRVHRDSRLFQHLTYNGVMGSLTRFTFAAGELRETAQRHRRVATPNQQLALKPNQPDGDRKRFEARA